MARFVKDGNFEYHIKNGIDYVIEEKNNSFIAFRQLVWGDDTDDPNKMKLDLRKWTATPEGEQCGKGVTFLSENGPNELVHVLVEHGYGNTTRIMNALAGRKDFFTTVKSYLGDTFTEEQAECFLSMVDNDIDENEEMYDPREEFDEYDYDEDDEVPFEEEEAS